VRGTLGKSRLRENQSEPKRQKINSCKRKKDQKNKRGKAKGEARLDEEASYLENDRTNRLKAQYPQFGHDLFAVRDSERGAIERWDGAGGKKGLKVKPHFGQR